MATQRIEVRVSAALAALSILAFMLASCSRTHDDSGSKRLRIVTQNMYEGTSFQELGAAQSPAQFVQAVTTTYRGIQATSPADRAAAIAREIAAASPHFVALQEASMVRTGAAAPATTVESDLLQLVVAELARAGHPYTVVSVLQGLDAEAPSTLGFDVRLTSQDAVLARSDASASEISWSNVQAHHYTATLSFPSPVGAIPFPRGYISVDANVNGHAFRFVTTHLEVEPHVAAAQAAELAAIESSSPLPVVIAGDFNAVASDPADPSYPAYRTFVTAGFADAWLAAHPGDPGFTCCEAGDLRNASPTLTQRIDLVLTTGGFGVDGVERIGIGASDRTPAGLWPSDHAGLVAQLVIP